MAAYDTPAENRKGSTFSTWSERVEDETNDVLDIIDGQSHECHEGKAPSTKLTQTSSSVIRFYPEWCQCFDCCLAPKRTSGLRQNTYFAVIRQTCVCPPSGPFARILEFMFLLLMVWLMLWLLLDNVDPMNNTPSPAAIGGPIFALFVLEVLGLFLGILMKCIRMPALLGPLLLGILIRNAESLNIFHNFEGWGTRSCRVNDTVCVETASRLSSHWIKPIRQIALTLILTRAGLELSPKQLRKLKGVVPLLAFGPCIVEAFVCALMMAILFNIQEPDPKLKMSAPMCFVAGFALAAVSPAVVVPGMVSLKKKGFGVDKGIPTLLMAASSIDDVLAISAYTICLGLAVSSEGDWETYAGGPIGLGIGVCHGFVVGSFLHFLPARYSTHVGFNRLILLLLFNLVSLFAYDLDELVSGAGSLSVLVTSFIASFGWRSQRHWKKPMKKIEHLLAHLWTLFVPLLFGTIGREIDFSGSGFHKDTIGKILGTIAVCLIVRCSVTYLIVGLANLNWKERLFCALSWIPKATVQAALAPLVLSRIRSESDKILTSANPLSPSALAQEAIKEQQLLQGTIVVTTAVVAILLTAPLGSILIALTGPMLLRKSDATTDEMEIEFPHGEGNYAEEDFELELFNSDSVIGSNKDSLEDSDSAEVDGVHVLLYPDNGGSVDEQTGTSLSFVAPPPRQEPRKSSGSQSIMAKFWRGGNQ